MIDKKFWKGRKVFITGHTGFKGSWLCLWLSGMGARVTGYSLDPPTEPSLFDLCDIGRLVATIRADVRDRARLAAAVKKAQPEIVLHLAAQPLVRRSYDEPVETYETNVLGTANLLEAVRHCRGVRSVINVTSDKCYENREQSRGYRESDPLGGYDPYANSKACSELVTAAYRSSFFNPGEYDKHGVALASARAGNVIGGGDWAEDRIVPDCVRALIANRPAPVRNPDAVRPWQFVLEPLHGYLLLAGLLYARGPEFAEAWNFGPDAADEKPVVHLVQTLCEKWGPNARFSRVKKHGPHETSYLKLDSVKSRRRLGWRPCWNCAEALSATAAWYKVFANGKDLLAVSRAQIDDFERAL